MLMAPKRRGHRRRASRQLGWVVAGLVLSGFGQVSDHSPEERFAGQVSWPEVGLASWYSQEDPGVVPLTASGETFSNADLTAAMWEVPFQSCIQVTNLKSLEQVAVRVNDRGPHKRLAVAGRVIDLSRAAFAQLADLDEGLIPVALQPVPSRRCVSAFAALTTSD